MKSQRGELLSLFAQIADPLTVCEACGTVGEFESAGDRRVCAGCHAGCGVGKCRDAYQDGRSPIEARLWRLAAHAQAGDQAAAFAFEAELSAYERSCS